MANIEAEQLTTPDLSFAANAVDGIRFDAYGNPVEYHCLRGHPSEVSSAVYDKIPAQFFLHWVRPDRPGQARGVPWITPCLGLFAQLRRWTLAALTRAETAANYSAILYTESAPDGAEQADPWDEVDISMGTMVTLPSGWRMGQFESKQDGNEYGAFKRELLKEIARCLNMPFNVVSGDSSNYNYASGRLDYQNWHRAIRVSRASFERVVLEHVFREWLYEASRVRNFLPLSFNAAEVPHGWFWDAVQHVDPIKDGTGDSLALANNTDTLANICASQGLDWEEVLEQRGQEIERMRELGLEIYLPDFNMVQQRELQEDIANQNNKGSFRDLIGGRN